MLATTTTIKTTRAEPMPWNSPLTPPPCTEFHEGQASRSVLVLVSCAKYQRYSDTEPQRWHALAHFEGAYLLMPDSWMAADDFDITEFVVGWQYLEDHPATKPPKPIRPGVV